MVERVLSVLHQAECHKLVLAYIVQVQEVL